MWRRLDAGGNFFVVVYFWQHSVLVEKGAYFWGENCGHVSMLQKWRIYETRLFCKQILKWRKCTEAIGFFKLTPVTKPKPKKTTNYQGGDEKEICLLFNLAIFRICITKPHTTQPQRYNAAKSRKRSPFIWVEN